MNLKSDDGPPAHQPSHAMQISPVLRPGNDEGFVFVCVEQAKRFDEW